MKTALMSLCVVALPLLATAQVCERTAGARPPLVVELYTSEGCSSCPPADRWLSSLKGRDDVLPLAFHVGYWDRLGWVDRFATRETTDRQYALARADGCAQRLHAAGGGAGPATGGAGRRLPASNVAAAAPMPLKLRRDGERVDAEVGARRGPLDGLLGRAGGRPSQPRQRRREPRRDPGARPCGAPVPAGRRVGGRTAASRWRCRRSMRRTRAASPSSWPARPTCGRCRR